MMMFFSFPLLVFFFSLYLLDLNHLPFFSVSREREKGRKVAFSSSSLS